MSNEHKEKYCFSCGKTEEKHIGLTRSCPKPLKKQDSVQEPVQDQGAYGFVKPIEGLEKVWEKPVQDCFMQVGRGFSFAEIGFDEWKAQGRSEEAIAGVLNFLTGAGGMAIIKLIKVQDKNIGMLRQWLNEDRKCEPMVTNEDIKHWLSL